MEDGGSQWKIGLCIVFLGVSCILLIGISMLFIDSSWNGNWKLRCKIGNIYSFQRIIQRVYWIKQIFVKMLQSLLMFQDQVIFNFSNYLDWIMFKCFFMNDWKKMLLIAISWQKYPPLPIQLSIVTYGQAQTFQENLLLTQRGFCQDFAKCLLSILRFTATVKCGHTLTGLAWVSHKTGLIY